MIKRLILFILICHFANASTLKVGDKISAFSLPNQFDKIHTITGEISIIIVSFDKETSNLINDFLSTKKSDFLDKKNAVFIDDISAVPSVIVKMFKIPRLRDYDYDVLLLHNENSKSFLEQDDKITVYFVKNSMVIDVKYLSTKDELERVFNDSF